MSRTVQRLSHPMEKLPHVTYFQHILHRHDDSFIAQDNQALQQGGRFGTAVGQVVYSRVLGRPDKWDGGEKAWPKWSFVMKAFFGSHRSGVVNGRDACRKQHGCVEQRQVRGRPRVFSQLYFVSIMLCTERALDRIANAPHGRNMEVWRFVSQAHSPKNNA